MKASPVSGPARSDVDGNPDNVEGCATCSTADMEAAPCAADDDVDDADEPDDVEATANGDGDAVPCAADEEMDG